MSLTQPGVYYDAAAPRVTQRTRLHKLAAIAAALIIGAAFVLRVATVGSSLPYVDHPDEPNPITYVVTMLQTGDPNPQFFQKPSLYVYLILAPLMAHYQLGVASGLYSDLNTMLVTTHKVTTIPGFFFWARVVTALVGALTVWIVYRFTTAVWNSGAGLAAALFIGLLPLHVRFSQYVTTDVTSAFLVLLTVAVAVQLADHGRWPAYLVAGAFAGLAASTKYNAGVVALAIVVAHLLYWQRAALLRLPRLVGAGLASIAAFLVGTPYALLDWPAFSQGLRGQWNAYSGEVGGHFRGAWNVGGYLEFFWDDGLLPVGVLLTLAGLAVLLRRKPRVALVWLAFVVPSLLLHLRMSIHFTQNMLPMIVLCALPIGVGVAQAGTWVGQNHPRLRAPAVALLLTLLLVPATSATAAYVSRQWSGDSRLQLLTWIEQNVPPGVRIAAELDPVPAADATRWTEVSDLPAYDLEWYRQQGYTYIIGSSHSWKQWTIPEEYLALGGTPVAEFGGADPEQALGPYLAVFATGLQPADVPQPPPATVQMGGAQFLGLNVGRPVSGKFQRDSGLDPAREFVPGEILGLRSFWQVDQPFDRDYFIFVHLLDANGQVVAQRDAPAWQGRYPTGSWQPGSLVADINDVVLPPNLPPGAYTIRIGMFDPATASHPPIVVAGVQQPVGGIEMGQITIQP